MYTYNTNSDPLPVTDLSINLFSNCAQFCQLWYLGLRIHLVYTRKDIGGFVTKRSAFAWAWLQWHEKPVLCLPDCNSAATFIALFYIQICYYSYIDVDSTLGSLNLADVGSAPDASEKKLPQSSSLKWIERDTVCMYICTYTYKVKLPMCQEDKRGSGSIAPPFLTSALDGGERSASLPVLFTPGKRAPVPIGKEAGCTLEPVWNLWRTDNPCLCQDSNAGRPAHSPSLKRPVVPTDPQEYGCWLCLIRANRDSRHILWKRSYLGTPRGPTTFIGLWFSEVVIHPCVHKTQCWRSSALGRAKCERAEGS
jgi:hypothetical protein